MAAGIENRLWSLEELVADLGLTMRDRDRGRQMVEEMTMEPFLDSYPRLTGGTVEIISQGESPDFLALIDGREMGIELTQIHAETPGEYLDEVVRFALKKEAIYDQRGVFSRPTILVCYGAYPPIYDMRDFLDGSPSWFDLTDLKFAEIWLMDLSDEYYSAQDPRRPADLYCLSPADLRGFHELPRTRKPYG